MQQNNPMELATPYPNNVRQCIKRQGYDIQEVADEIGISRRTMSKYLSGKVPIPRNYLEKIAQTIGCEIEELLISPANGKHAQPPSPVISTTPSNRTPTIQLLTDKEKELVKFLLIFDDDPSHKYQSLHTRENAHKNCKDRGSVLQQKDSSCIMTKLKGIYEVT